jgi:NTP pyrophosphatase (non-canonical NTP hydrolase)
VEIVMSSSIYQKAIDAWGVESQLSMATGECGELIAEINRCFTQGKSSLEDVAGEIADVEIMMAQLRLIVGNETVERIKLEKLVRLERILKGSIEHPHKIQS